jgi:hypothetical protein
MRKFIKKLLLTILATVMAFGLAACAWDVDKSDGDIAIETPEGILPVSVELGAFSISVEGSSTVLMAAITPSNATNQLVDWSTSWVNSSSSWSTGKTVSDYLTVTPVSDGGLSATVACLEAFGEQIKIQVISRENSAVKAACIVDYRQRLVNQGLTISDGNTTVNYVSNLQYAVIDFDGTWNTNVSSRTVSAGTLIDSYATTIKLSVDEGAIFALSGIGVVDIPATYSNPITIPVGSNAFTLNAAFFKQIFGAANYDDPVKYNKIVNLFANNSSGMLVLQVASVGAYSSKTNFYLLDFSSSSLTVSPESIALEASLVF